MSGPEEPRQGITNFQVLVFEVGGRTCGLATDAVREILPMVWLARPPGLPPLVEGFLNLRGEAVPVLRLERLLDGAATAPGLHTPLLVLRGSGGLVAWRVDRVSEVVEIPESDRAPVRFEHCWNECTRAQARRGDRVVHLLDPERLLLEAERQRLAELRAAAEQYLKEWPACPS